MNIREIFKGAFFFKEIVNQSYDPFGPFFNMNGFWSDRKRVAHRLKDQENGLYIVYDYDYDAETKEYTFAHCSLVEKQDNGTFARPDKTGIVRSMFKELEEEFNTIAANSQNYGKLIKFTSGS